MTTRIRIAWPGGEVCARLDDTPTAQALAASLPCEAVANTWGEEVYFELPFGVAREPDAKQVVQPGTVCFWVEGRSLALPYGPTPISQGPLPRLVTRCNVLGRIEGEPRRLAEVRDGDRIRLEAIEV